MQEYWSLPRDFIAKSEIVINKSRFLGYAKMVTSVDGAQQFIKSVKEQHYDARHVVYAYRLFDSSRSTDDGEPSGTAGKPILEWLIHKDIYQIVMVVVRYFGGVLLGTGGLVRAYTQSTIDTLEQNLVKWQSVKKYRLKTDYSGYQNLIAWAKNKNVKIDNVVFADNVVLEIILTNNYDPPQGSEYIGNCFDYLI